VVAKGRQVVKIGRDRRLAMESGVSPPAFVVKIVLCDWLHATTIVISQREAVLELRKGRATCIACPGGTCVRWTA
jgi:hypothetical protein